MNAGESPPSRWRLCSKRIDLLGNVKREQALLSCASLSNECERSVLGMGGVAPVRQGW